MTNAVIGKLCELSNTCMWQEAPYAFFQSTLHCSCVAPVTASHVHSDVGFAAPPPKVVHYPGCRMVPWQAPSTQEPNASFKLNRQDRKITGPTACG